MKKIRVEFADTMLEIGPQDPDLVVMVGDISHGILQKFAKECPGRYYNVGICEPTIVNMAAGVAKAGLVPVVHTIAPFLIERAYEQIKLDFGYQILPINLVSVGGAFDYSQLGCSHHCYTDFSLMSHFARASVFCAGSPVEFNQLFKQTYRNGGINYYRIPEYAHRVEFRPEQIQAGKGICVREGHQITLATFGTSLNACLDAADILAGCGISAEVLYFHTIKPIDQELVEKSLTKTKRLFSVEETSASDGLLNRIWAASRHIPTVCYEQLAIEDFIHGYGSYEDLCEKVGLTATGVADRAKKFLKDRA